MGQTVGDERKRLLMQSVLMVVGTAFPPASNAGAHRILGWARNLPDLGWKVTILTLPLRYWPDDLRDDSLLKAIPQSVDVVRVAPRLLRRFPDSILGDTKAQGSLPARKVRRAIKRGKGYVLFPDSRLLWLGPASRAARHLAARGLCDVMLTSSPERSSHLVGLRATRVTGCAWVADFRDPWETSWQPPPTALHGRVLHTLGSKIVRTADKVVVVAPGLKRQVIETYSAEGHRISVVTNGVDEDLVNVTPGDTPKDGKFRFVHTGRFYGRRSPVGFVRAVADLLQERVELANRIEVVFVGSFDDAARAALRPFIGESWIHLVGEVAHADISDFQRSASVLLLVPGEDSHTIPGKLFEYLAARRPILALCASDTDTSRFFEEFGGGLVVDPSDSLALRKAIERLVSGDVPSMPDPEQVIRTHGRRAKAAEISTILSDAVSTSRGRRW